MQVSGETALKSGTGRDRQGKERDPTRGQDSLPYPEVTVRLQKPGDVPHTVGRGHNRLKGWSSCHCYCSS